MTPEENRRRIRELRTSDDAASKTPLASSRQPIHNSAEALFIKKMNEGGEGHTKLHHPRRIA